MAGGNLVAHSLPHPLRPLRLARERRDRGRDRRAAHRQLFEGGDVEVAVHGHGDRARNRRRGHHENVRPTVVARLRTQRVALLDAELVLLVDDDETEICELHLVFKQCVRADDDAGRTRGCIEHCLAPSRLG